MAVALLILGAGWSSTFLIEQCIHSGISYAATSRSGRQDTIKFSFDEGTQPEDFEHLPTATTVLITFPLTVPGSSERLVKLYNSTGGRLNAPSAAFIQLGTTSIWDGSRDAGVTKLSVHKWYDRNSSFTETDRAKEETALLQLSPNVPTTVLNLSGLWGGTRNTRNWVSKVAPTKEALRQKGSLHMIHGLDVARAIIAVHSQIDKAIGQRWLLSDMRVYDWWDLVSAWGIPSTPHGDNHGPQPGWVRELMAEEGFRGLPREPIHLGRALDSTEFWHTFQLSPLKARLED